MTTKPINKDIQDNWQFIKTADEAVKAVALIYSAFQVVRGGLWGKKTPSTATNTLELVKGVGALVAVSGCAIACVSAYVSSRYEKSRCRIKLNDPETCHAVLYFMTVALPPPAWVHVHELSLGKGRRSVLVPDASSGPTLAANWNRTPHFSRI